MLPSDIITCLTQIDPFKDLHLHQLKHLCNCSTLLPYHPRQTLFRQNQPAQSQYINLSGTIHLYRYYDKEVPYTKDPILKLKGLCDLKRDQANINFNLWRKIGGIVDGRVGEGQGKRRRLVEEVRGGGVFGGGGNVRGFEAVAGSQGVCLVVPYEVVNTLKDLPSPKIDQSEPRRRASFSEIMDMQIAKIDWQIKQQKVERRRAMSTVRMPRLYKNVNTLSEFYKNQK